MFNYAVLVGTLQPSMYVAEQAATNMLADAVLVAFKTVLY